MEKLTTKLSIRLPDDLVKYCEAEAKRLDRTVNWVIRDKIQKAREVELRDAHHELPAGASR